MTPHPGRNAPRFQHFVLTRFNVKTRYGEKRFGPGIRLSPDWLNRRLELFDRFCYPSVCGQRCRDFTWLVFFDDQTPGPFRRKIAGRYRLANFVPVYVQAGRGMGLQRVIAEHLRSDARFLITTRLDSDDAICKDYLRMVQGQFRCQENEFINFTYGYAWKDGETYRIARASNPFISRIEAVSGGFGTVSCCMHNETHKAGKVRELKAKPSWLQVIHEINVANRLPADAVREPVRSLRSEFGIRRYPEAARERLLRAGMELAREYLIRGRGRRPRAGKGKDGKGHERGS